MAAGEELRSRQFGDELPGAAAPAPLEVEP
jgi:hypothetical protein